MLAGLQGLWQQLQPLLSQVMVVLLGVHGRRSWVLGRGRNPSLPIYLINNWMFGLCGHQVFHLLCLMLMCIVLTRLEAN